MRTFVLRARHGSVDPDRLAAQVGESGHSEIIAHVLANAFYLSLGVREDVEVYIALDGTADFPRTLRFCAAEGLSMPGFHEAGILEVVKKALRSGKAVTKNGTLAVAPGITVLGFGFDVLMQQLLEKRTVYLLDRKGDDVRGATLAEDPVFVLSDHLPMPKNSIKGMERRGLKTVSVGRRMLFASQCVVLLHNELDRGEQGKNFT